VRTWRFLLSRRWVVFAVVVALLAWLAWWLGEWQFDRLEERQARNAVVERNESLPPAPVAELTGPGREVAAGDQWRLVTATGTYDVDDTVIVRYRTRDGASGVDVVVPLVTESGTALLVDRGWVAADNRGTDAGDVPPPPRGEVTVTGWLRRDATGDSTAVTDRSTRAISSDRIGGALGREVYGGFVDLRSEDPAPAQPLARPELPELDNGPHFFYGLQWWFFGLLALFGFGYLAWDERRGSPRRRGGPGVRPREDQNVRIMPPSTGSMVPVRNEAAGESRKAATRPNSSGSP
jgi:cytochrome oxidase assembly protein ShyY1